MGTTKAPDHRGSATLPPADRRSAALFVGGVLLAVVGLVVVIATLLVDTDDPDEPTDPTDQVAAPDVSSPSPETTPPDGRDADRPPMDGLAVAAAVISSSAIEVVETIRWPDGGPATIELVLADGAASAAGLGIAPEPTVADLVVLIDGLGVTPAPRAGVPNAWVVTTPDGSPSTMEVRYVLGGAIVRSVPASPGRALAVITPISASASGGLPIVIAISATDVLNVYCPAGSTPSAVRCGRLQGDRWNVELPPGLPLVVAQLDLPAPA